MDDIKDLSWENFSKIYNLSEGDYGNGKIFHFPPSWQNGWIMEIHPRDSVFTASTWFTPHEDMKFTINSQAKALWILCIDSGDIEVSRKGVKNKILSQNTQILINSGKTFTINFKKDEHYCFTSVLLSESYLDSLTQGIENPPKISLANSKNWQEEHINTPNIMLIMEQIRWAVRTCDISHLGYHGMIIHLLTSIDRNYPKIPPRRRNRRHYVTWENEQKIFKVKSKIDSDVLNVPDILDLCRLAEMSETKLREGFKNIYHITIYAYIRREIMKKAMLLLSSDHLSIKNISEQCGFKNPSKFSAAFKDIHGITPSEFRKSFNL